MSNSIFNIIEFGVHSATITITYMLFPLVAVLFMVFISQEVLKRIMSR